MINFWTKLRASLWFIPGLMLISAIALALGLIELDTRIDGKWLAAFPRLFGLGADGSRGMLTAIASSMLTVAALTFALTLNAMTQASGQFTPRIFRNFMRDRAYQFSLGYFVSIFVYCLLVLRTIRGGDEIKFLPSLAVLVGLLLALIGVIVLIFAIHHIANSLQITNIIHHIVDETKKAIKVMFPTEIVNAENSNDEATVQPAAENQTWLKIPALRCGYVQSVDIKGLLKFAEENQLVLQMQRCIGQFAGRGAALLSVQNSAKSQSVNLIIDAEKITKLNQFFAIDNHRTIEQDVDFGIRQVVDIALKALSPGVNDTTTAVTCIDFIGEIVGEIARRELPVKNHTKKNGARVIALTPSFQDYVATAFDQIRISGKANLAIFERLLEAVAFVAQCTVDKTRRASLQKQMSLIAAFAAQTLETDDEKAKLARKVASVRKVFN